MKCSSSCLSGDEPVGFGATPQEPGCRAPGVLLGLGKAQGFLSSGLPPALIKRKRHLQASLPLNSLYGNWLSSAVPVSLPPSRREHILTSST